MNVTATTQGTPAATSPTGKQAPRKTETTGNNLPATGKPAPQAKPAPPPVSIDKALQQIQAFLNDSKRELTFERDESSGRTIIRVIDPASGDVIRQFPSEEVLKIAAILDAQGFRTLNELA